MFLQSAHIRHFKSLGDVTVDFAGPVTVLVGPNASGKTNVVEALKFVRDAALNGLESTVREAGGMGRIRQQLARADIDIDMAFSDLARYRLTLGTPENAGIEILEELAQWPESPGISRGLSGQTKAFDGSNSTTSVPSDRLALGYLTDKQGRRPPILDFIRGWHCTSIDPQRMRQPALPDGNTALLDNGGNWASVLKNLAASEAGLSALDRIHESMRVAVSGFEQADVLTLGSYLIPSFQFTWEGGSKTFDAAQLSEGTLRIFSILLALYQSPPATLIMLEEPEMGVHPGVLAVLADAIHEAAGISQIVITTHSPQFVDHFQPEQVRVVTMNDGETRVSPIKSSQVEAVKRHLMSLQDFMSAEGLQPAIP